MTDAEYLFALRDAFFANKFFSQLFDVITVLAKIQLVCKYPDRLLSGAIGGQTFIGLQLQFTEAIPRPQNHTAYIKAVSVRRTIERVGAYDLLSKTCVFNLKDVVDALHPPVPATISIVNTYSQQAIDSTDSFFLQFGNRIDNIEEKLQSTIFFSALYGRKPTYELGFTFPDASKKVQICHATTSKLIVEGQPDYLCLYFTEGLFAKIRVFCKNAAGVPIGGFTLVATSGFEANTVHLFSVGELQLRSLLPVGAISYYVAVEDDLSSIEYCYREYYIEQAATDTQFLLHSNGLGGCETIAYGGASEVTHKLNKVEFTGLDRQFKAINISRQIEYKVATTYFEDENFGMQLMDLMDEPAWLIDLENNAFLPILINADSATLKTTDNLYSLEFLYKRNL
jgi:hypothetical protein